nr:hypothetical protein [Tanacetum cinerariifolium]
MSFGADGWENVTTPIPAADGEALYDQRGYLLFSKMPLKHLCETRVHEPVAIMCVKPYVSADARSCYDIKLRDNHASVTRFNSYAVIASPTS